MIYVKKLELIQVYRLARYLKRLSNKAVDMSGNPAVSLSPVIDAVGAASQVNAISKRGKTKNNRRNDLIEKS